jgi:hypothetical protein
LKLGQLEKFVGRGQLLKQGGFGSGGHRWGLCHRDLKKTRDLFRLAPSFLRFGKVRSSLLLYK